MKFIVHLSTFLLISIGRSLSSYDKIWTSALFGRLFIRTNGGNDSETQARRSRRWMSTEGQSNKECSVSSVPSFYGFIGSMVSRKLCLNLWQFNLLRPTLIWVIYVKPIGSWIPNRDFAGGRIIDNSFFLENSNRRCMPNFWIELVPFIYAFGIKAGLKLFSSYP